MLGNFHCCCHPTPTPNPTLPQLNRKRQGSHTGSCSHRSLLVSCWQVDGSWFPGFWPSPDIGLASRAFLTGSQPLCFHRVPLRAQYLSVGLLHLLSFPSLEEGHPHAGPHLSLGREVLDEGHLESYCQPQLGSTWPQLGSTVFLALHQAQDTGQPFPTTPASLPSPLHLGPLAWVGNGCDVLHDVLTGFCLPCPTLSCQQQMDSQNFWLLSLSQLPVPTRTPRHYNHHTIIDK